jgi:PST family polysaccharide transporter
LSSAASSSKSQILKSSAVVGSASAVTLVMGLFRQKAIALLLGPAGGGIWAMSWSIVELARGIAGLGVNTSGVRQIAAAASTNDPVKVARTVVTLRRVSLGLGCFGALSLLALAAPIGRLSFNDSNHTLAVMVLSATVLFSIVSQGQAALIQGMRRIRDLAKINIAGAVGGTLVAIPVVYFLREQGIAPALVAVSLMTLLASWWFARKIQVTSVTLSSREVRTEASGLLRLGFLFMVSGLMTLGVGYLVNVMLLRLLGKEAVGLYQAAWLLGGYFSGFIVQAMGADFYPRLTAAAEDHVECNRLVNEQAEVGLLLAGPGLIGTLLFAPLAIRLVNSSEFLPAVDVLRWISVGMLLRILAWPVGFVLLAKNAQRLFFFCELGSNALYLIMAWGAIQQFGLNGAGIAFPTFYLIYATGIYWVVRRLTGFRWAPETLAIAAAYLSLAMGTLAAMLFLPSSWAMAIGLMALIVTSVFSAKKLAALLPAERFPDPIRKLLRCFGVGSEKGGA